VVVAAHRLVKWV